MAVIVSVCTTSRLGVSTATPFEGVTCPMLVPFEENVTRLLGEWPCAEPGMIVAVSVTWSPTVTVEAFDWSASDVVAGAVWRETVPEVLDPKYASP